MLNFYVLGALWSLGALQTSIAALWARDVRVATAWLVPARGGWWIIAGIGIRLGMSPRDFFDSLSHTLGCDRRSDRSGSG